MTRDEEIKEAAKHFDSNNYFGFIEGAQWADNTNPRELQLLRKLEQYINDKNSLIRISTKMAELLRLLHRMKPVDAQYLAEVLSEYDSLVIDEK